MVIANDHIRFTRIEKREGLRLHTSLLHLSEVRPGIEASYMHVHSSLDYMYSCELKKTYLGCI